jgi:DNA repair protein RadA/Sms
VVLLAGHVTKSGEVAGPRILEHMVDTVLYMEGSEQSEHRLLRSMKNRFGSTSEVGVFSMTEKGLVDVLNPSELFLTPLDDDPALAKRGQEGAAVGVLMEGTRCTTCSG